METTMTPLRYLMQELSLSSKDWTNLSEKDKEDLKQYAAEEMESLRKGTK